MPRRGPRRLEICESTTLSQIGEKGGRSSEIFLPRPRRAQGQHPANTTPQHGSWRPVYFVSDAGGGWNVRVRLQAKAGGAMGCAIATTLGMMLQTARQLSEMRLAVSSSRHWPSWSRCGRITRARSSIAPEVRRSPPIFTCTRYTPASHQRWPHSQLTPRSARAVAA